MNDGFSAAWFLVVAAMWGGTNPLIKKGSQGVENIKEDTKIRQFLMELKFLFFNWKMAAGYLVKSALGIGILFVNIFCCVWLFTLLIFNKVYLIPFLINQGGSIVYYMTLATADLSLAVPITNSLTFIFTSLSGRLLGEKPPPWETYVGMAFVVCGVALCVADKV